MTILYIIGNVHLGMSWKDLCRWSEFTLRARGYSDVAESFTLFCHSIPCWQIKAMGASEGI